MFGKVTCTTSLPTLALTNPNPDPQAQRVSLSRSLSLYFSHPDPLLLP